MKNNFIKDFTNLIFQYINVIGPDFISNDLLKDMGES